MLPSPPSSSPPTTTTSTTAMELTMGSTNAWKATDAVRSASRSSTDTATRPPAATPSRGQSPSVTPPSVAAPNCETMGNRYEERYNSILEKLFPIIVDAALSNEHYMEVMRVLRMLRLKYGGSKFESSQSSLHRKCLEFFTRNEGSVATQRKVRLSKRKVRLSKRKVLIVKRIVEQAKKKQRNKFLAKQKRRKNQTCESIQEEEMNTSEVPLNSTTCIHHGRVIGTEDSVMPQGSQEITKLIAAGAEKLALAPVGGGTFDCDTSFNLFN